MRSQALGPELPVQALDERVVRRLAMPREVERRAAALQRLNPERTSRTAGSLRVAGQDVLPMRGRALDWFHRVGIPEAERRLKAYLHEISDGMRQSTMIALALACRPHVLLADEPTTAWDATV